MNLHPFASTRCATLHLRTVASLALLSLGALGISESAVAQEESRPEIAEEPRRETPGFVSFPLGEFVMKDFHPVEHEQVKIRMTVHVEVAEAEAKRFKAMWPRYEHRVRSQVITATRLVSPLEFDDPMLKVLLRRIYLRLRRALPELPVEEVYVSDFSYLVE